MTTHTPPFDTHRTIERLIKSGGFDKKQAEAIAEAVNDGLTGGVATSADIARLETRLTNQTWKIVLIGVGMVGGFIAYATSVILSAMAG